MEIINHSQDFKIALIGMGKRAFNVYLPLFKKLKNKLTISAFCSRTNKTNVDFSGFDKVPFYTSVDKLLSLAKIDIAIINTGRKDHLEPALKLLDAKIPILIETPLDDKIDNCLKIIKKAKANSVKIEIGENVYRMPRYRAVKKFIDTGVIGNINLIYTDFLGHGYHGFSLIRSLFNFKTLPVSISGFTENFNVKNHVWRKGFDKTSEDKWQHSIVKLDNGSYGVFSFSSLTNGSPMRMDKNNYKLRCYGSNGMAEGLDFTILSENDSTLTINGEMFYKKGSLEKIVINNKAKFNWENPYKNFGLTEIEISIAECIFELIDSIDKNREPEYGCINGYIDRLLEVTMEESSKKNKRIDFKQNQFNILD